MLVADGLDLEREDLGIYLRIVEGLDGVPGVRGSDDVIPGRRGRVQGEWLGDVRRVVLAGVFTDGDSVVDPGSQMRAYLDEAKRILSPERRTLATLTTLVEDGTPRWINFMARNWIVDNRIPELRKVSIELEAIDPYWYGNNGGIALDSGFLLDAGLFLDGDAPLVVNPTALDEHYTFDTFGTADVTDVVIEIDGPTSPGGDPGFYIYNESAVPGIGFRYDVELLAGETLVVDAGRRLVTKGGVNARADLVLPWAGNLHGEYFRIHPGETTLRIHGKPAEVRISFNAVYL